MTPLSPLSLDSPESQLGDWVKRVNMMSHANILTSFQFVIPSTPNAAAKKIITHDYRTLESPNVSWVRSSHFLSPPSTAVSLAISERETLELNKST